MCVYPVILSSISGHSIPRLICTFRPGFTTAVYTYGNFFGAEREWQFDNCGGLNDLNICLYIHLSPLSRSSYLK